MADEGLEALRRRFRVRCAEDMTVIEAALADPRTATGEPFTIVVHRLSGMAGSFGFADLSRIAGGIDDQLASGLPVRAADLARLHAALLAVATPPGGAG